MPILVAIAASKEPAGAPRQATEEQLRIQAPAFVKLSVPRWSALAL